MALPCCGLVPSFLLHLHPQLVALTLFVTTNVVLNVNIKSFICVIIIVVVVVVVVGNH